MKLISWNVNGIRAVHKKGFLEWFLKEKADIVCVQETKAHEEQVPEDVKNISGYSSYFSMGERKGYSGVGVWSKIPPISVKSKFGIKALDGEGRILELEFNDFFLFNVYFPNGKASEERLSFKLKFYGEFLKYIKKKKKPVIFCGDVNTAHKEIDLARPKQNEKTSGFLPEERVWIDKFISSGFLDSLRVFDTRGENYTWWDLKSYARDRNIGWRIDYFFISSDLRGRLKSAKILTNVYGSDHCPISIELTDLS